MPKKPIETLTWKKNDKYITIDKTIQQITFINRKTGQQDTVQIVPITQIPPTKRERK